MAEDPSTNKTHKKSRGTRADLSAYSPATIFRTRHYDRASAELIEQTARKLVPAFLLNLDPLMQRIERAARNELPAELLDLGDEVTGLTRFVWAQKVYQLGPGIISLVQQRLSDCQTESDRDACRARNENLIGLLRWHVGEGAGAILDVFDRLDGYGKSLASVSLGLLGEGRAAGKIWDFYHRARAVPLIADWIGALWALLDLEDTGLDHELAELLTERRIFPELFGFISRAGGEETTLPLLLYAIEVEEDLRPDAFMALVGIVNRLGKQRFAQLLARMVEADAPQEEIEAVVAEILTYSETRVREYFPIYYRGMQATDLQSFMLRQ